MKLRSKETYWLLKNGLVNTYPSLQKDVECDVLIIGSGITGALMAYQLCSEGFKTIVVDKRDVAMGSTAATTAMLQYEIDEPLHKLIKKVGEAAAVDSYREGVVSIDNLERITKKLGARCGFGKKKSVYLASAKGDCEWLEQEMLCRKKFKLKVSWLSGTQLKEQYRVSAHGAILSEAGASVDAYRLAHMLIGYSVKHYGLRVFDHTSVDVVDYNTDINIVLTDDRKQIRSKYIVYATGYETADLLKEKIVDLNSTYAFVSEPMMNIPSQLRKTIFWNTENPYLYMRVTTDNRILVGGGDEKFENAKRRDNIIEKKEKYLADQIRKLLPGINLIPDFSWAGTFGVTKDALPYIGAHPKYPNSFFVLGFGGNGITFSVMAMKIISDALSGRPNKFLEHFRFNR